MIATATKIRPIANATLTGRTAHPAELVSHKAVYRTELGAAYASDALKVLQSMPDRSVSAVITSPPYALHFKKEYGNVDKQNYTQWMLPSEDDITMIALITKSKKVSGKRSLEERWSIGWWSKSPKRSPKPMTASARRNGTSSRPGRRTTCSGSCSSTVCMPGADIVSKKDSV